MTKEELNKKHMVLSIMDAPGSHHSKVSIEYAISVLEEVKNSHPIFFEDSENSTDSAIPMDNIFDKIQSLKSLIK